MATNDDNSTPNDSATKNAAPVSSQNSVKSPLKPKSSGIGAAKTEVPILPASNYEIPRYTRDNQPIVGNKAYELSLRMDGRLGHCLSRENTAFPEVNCDLNAANYRAAVEFSLKHVLTDLTRLKQPLSDTDITARVEQVAKVLTTGTMVMTYLKLRAINLFRPDQTDKYLLKPKVPDHFEVPTPFALAISQLGVVEVSSLPKRKICYPTADAANSSTYFCALRNDWSQTAYAEAVRYAKSLGMDFSTVPIDVKVGSSWWLYQPKITDGLYSLRCVLPEDNYTLAGAAVYMLFVSDARVDPPTEIFNLSNIEDVDYGSFIRNPRDGFNLAAYYAVSKEGDDDMWKSSV